MPPRATLAKLKKQMDAPNRSNAKAVDPPEFSQSDKLSAMEKRFIAMELRLEEMAKVASSPVSEPVANQSSERDDRFRAMELRLEEMAKMVAVPVPEPVANQSSERDDRFRAMELRLEELNRAVTTPKPVTVDKPAPVSPQVDERIKAMERRIEALSSTVATLPVQTLQPITPVATQEPPMLFLPAVYGVKMTEMLFRLWWSPMLFLYSMHQSSSKRDGC